MTEETLLFIRVMIWFMCPLVGVFLAVVIAHKLGWLK